MKYRAETLWQRLKAINSETAAILAQARQSQNHVIALQAIARVERQVELEARLLGELRVITLNPEHGGRLRNIADSPKTTPNRENSALWLIRNVPLCSATGAYCHISPCTRRRQCRIAEPPFLFP